LPTGGWEGIQQQVKPEDLPNHKQHFCFRVKGRRCNGLTAFIFLSFKNFLKAVITKNHFKNE
jgi:hypothetical protein